jgi:hypothetical protein
LYLDHDYLTNFSEAMACLTRATADIAKALTFDEARRIAVNVAKAASRMACMLRVDG